MSKKVLLPVMLASASIFLTGYFAGCGGSDPVGGGGGRGVAGNSGTGGTGTGTGGMGTGGAGTGGAGTGGAGTGTGGVGTGGAGTGGAGTAGAAGGASGGAGGASGSAAGGSGGGAVGGRGGGASGGRGGASAGGAGGVGGTATTALATIAPLTPGTITGTAAFTNVANGVQVTINLSNCPAGVHPIHIHEGTSCASTAAQGMHWGGTNGPGENIGPNGGEITCNSAMTGTLMYTRMNTPAATAWTIGGPAGTNVIGHPFIVHSSTNVNDRHGCGVIQAN